MRVALLRGGVDLEPQSCAQCGKRMIFGIVYAVKIEDEKFRVCSFECEKKLKENKAKQADEAA